MDFFIGLLLGAVGGFAVAVFSEAGKDFYYYIKNRINPPPQPDPHPIEIDKSYPDNHIPKEILAENSFSWVAQSKVRSNEKMGYQFYLDEGRKCYQVSVGGPWVYLMYKPKS